MYSKDELKKLKVEFWESFAAYCEVQPYLRRRRKMWVLYNTKVKGMELKFDVNRNGAYVILEVNHRQEDVAKAVTLHFCSHSTQSSVDALHSYLTHSLEYLVNALGLGGVIHKRLVYHNSTEPFALRLLKNEYELCYLQIAWVGNIERFLPSGVALHRGEYFLYFRSQRMMVGARPNHGVNKHLK